MLDFAGKSGPSTLFELDVERGYDISRLSCASANASRRRSRCDGRLCPTGSHQLPCLQVLLPLLTQLQVIGLAVAAANESTTRSSLSAGCCSRWTG